MIASLSSRNNVAAGIMLIVSLLVCAASTVPASAQTDSNVKQAGQEKKEYFNDEDLKVEKIPGKWRLGFLFDSKQLSDPSVPVVVTALKTVYGREKYPGRVKVPELKIENRSQKVLESVQLRWAIVDNEDREAVLLEGVTPFIRARIEPFNSPL